jgi:hypothetical protein
MGSVLKARPHPAHLGKWNFSSERKPLSWAEAALRPITALTLLVLVLACPPLGAQVEASAGYESRVRIVSTPADTGPSVRHVGILSGIRADTLLITLDGETTPRKVPLAHVREVAVSRGHESYARNAGRAGAIVGGLALGGLTYLEESTSSTCREGCVYDNPAVVPMTILGLAAGALGGWYVGSHVGSRVSTERWERIPLDSLSVYPSQRGLVLRMTAYR